jgi:hypothetical protein
MQQSHHPQFVSPDVQGKGSLFLLGFSPLAIRPVGEQGETLQKGKDAGKVSVDVARPKGGRRNWRDCFFCIAPFGGSVRGEGWKRCHSHARQGRWVSCHRYPLPHTHSLGLVRWCEHERAELEEEEEGRREHRPPAMGVLWGLQEGVIGIEGKKGVK